MAKLYGSTTYPRERGRFWQELFGSHRPMLEYVNAPDESSLAMFATISFNVKVNFVVESGRSHAVPRMFCLDSIWPRICCCPIKLQTTSVVDARDLIFRIVPWHHIAAADENRKVSNPSIHKYVYFCFQSR